MVVHFDSEPDISELEKTDESEGSLSTNELGDKLLNSLIAGDPEKNEDGRLIESALNQGIGAFTPDMMMERMVSNFKLAKKLYGETILRQLTGEDPDFTERNIHVPEFQKKLKQNIEQNLKRLRKDKLLDNDNAITDKGIQLASVVMYMEELDNIIPKGIRGERLHKKQTHYGGKDETKSFKKGDRYKDLAVRRSLRTAIRRGHKNLEMEDLKIYERQSKGECHIIYAIDASGSMKGDKISNCKKAGVALAYKAIHNKDKVGLIVFGDEIRDFIEPTFDFPKLLHKIVGVKASKQTDIVKTIKKAIRMFHDDKVTRHLLLLTDALPTAGADPERETLAAISVARNMNITISLIGIELDDRGSKLAEKIVEIGKGRLYKITSMDEIDKIVLQDYYSVA